MTSTQTVSRAARVARGTEQGRRRRTVLLFLLPGIVGLSAFFIYPLFATLFYSFTSFDLIGDPSFVGLRNYVYMFTKDPLFWKAAGNTAWLTIVITIGRVVFALGVALVLVRVRRGAGVFRTLFYLPSLTPPVAAVLSFVFLLNPGTGPVNQFLALFGIEGPLWFNDPAFAKPGLAVISLWMSGTVMVIFLAALLDVPGELYEAASLDGAGAFAQFRHVTLPAITPVLLFAVINSVIVGLQFFTEAMVAGQTASGDPSTGMGYPDNSTLTFPMWLFEQGFREYHMGYASAMAIALFVVSGLFTIILVRRMRFAGVGED
ncbi:MAG: sugar ABC transporter permease [Actinobacteria bacterium]|nr:sugar ABC transporter permease [Actinomycetota bacterium]